MYPSGLVSQLGAGAAAWLAAVCCFVSLVRLGAEGAALALRHSEHAHLLSDIEKLTLPILGSMFPFWSPTGDLVCQLEATST